MKLWYISPASQWEEALALGSGRMGAMVFSDTIKERICLNEDTLWSGGPWRYDSPCRKYWDKALHLVQQGKNRQAQTILENHMQFPYTEAYEPFGEINIGFENFSAENISSYRRELDLETAMTICQYKHNEQKITQSCFISNADQLMVWHMLSEYPSNILISLSSVLKNELFSEGKRIGMLVHTPSYSAPNYLGDIPNPIRYEEGEKQGLTGVCMIEVITDGKKSIIANNLQIENAKAIEIRLAMRSNFENYDIPPAKSCIDAKDLVRADLNKAKSLKYKELLHRHLEEYQPYFSRVSLSLTDEKEPDDIPTDIRLQKSTALGGDKKLIEIIFQYGRYLLIASSRPNTQAATLQGIWNPNIRPPWSSNYTLNINTEMNYWPAEICNLSEMHGPLFDLIERLRITGANTAKITYSANGAVCHHNTDLWAHTQAVGEGDCNSAMWSQWPMGYVWLAQHMIMHFRYSRDIVFLKERALPVLRDACAFLDSLMVWSSDGQIAFSPATSPENSFLSSEGPCALALRSTMTDTLVLENFKSYLETLSILNINEPLGNRIRAILSALPHPAIGTDGRLLEWDSEYTETEPDHRHVSHLYGLYPGNTIAPNTTLADACKKSLSARGDAGTGWSLGWKLCLWARLGDGEHAMRLLNRQLTPYDPQSKNGHTYPNLFDAHPPFQIDGNFSACAGIAEMLLSCDKDNIRILHALPQSWPRGQIKGLRTPGGYEAELHWEDGKLSKIIFSSAVLNPTAMSVHYKNKTFSLLLDTNETITLYPKDFGIN